MNVLYQSPLIIQAKNTLFGDYTRFTFNNEYYGLKWFKNELELIEHPNPNRYVNIPRLFEVNLGESETFTIRVQCESQTYEYILVNFIGIPKLMKAKLEKNTEDPNPIRHPLYSRFPNPIPLREVGLEREKIDTSELDQRILNYGSYYHR